MDHFDELMRKWEDAEKRWPGRYAKPKKLFDDTEDKARLALIGFGIAIRAIDGEPGLEGVKAWLEKEL